MHRLKDDGYLVAYIDESYVDGGVYWVAAAIIDSDKCVSLESAFRAIAKRYESDGIRQDAEFHGYEIFHMTGHWQGFYGRPALAVSAFKQGFEAVVASQPRFFILGVNQQRLKARYGDFAFHPHEVALHNLLDKVNRYAKTVNKKVVLVADKVEDFERREERMLAFQKNGTMGYSPSKLTQIDFPICWEDSSRHPGLQAVDMGLFFYQRRANVRVETHSRAEREMLHMRELMFPLLEYRNIWNP